MDDETKVAFTLVIESLCNLADEVAAIKRHVRGIPDHRFKNLTGDLWELHARINNEEDA